MKLSVWAKSQGLSYKTAWRLWKEGKLPVPAEQLLTGPVIVHPPVITTEGCVALYARGANEESATARDGGGTGVAPPTNNRDSWGSGVVDRYPPPAQGCAGAAMERWGG